METSKVTNPTVQKQVQSAQKRALTDDELKRLTDFFSLLIQIDRRITKAKTYGKQSK